MSSSELGDGSSSSPRKCCPLFQRWSVTCQHHTVGAYNASPDSLVGCGEAPCPYFPLPSTPSSSQFGAHRQLPPIIGLKYDSVFMIFAVFEAVAVNVIYKLQFLYLLINRADELELCRIATWHVTHVCADTSAETTTTSLTTTGPIITTSPRTTPIIRTFTMQQYAVENYG